MKLATRPWATTDICAKPTKSNTDKHKWSQQTGRRPKGLHRLNGDMKPTHRTKRYEGGEPSTNDYDQQTQVFDSHTLIELKVDFKCRRNKPYNPTVAIPTWVVSLREKLILTFLFCQSSIVFYKIRLCSCITVTVMLKWLHKDSFNFSYSLATPRCEIG